MELILETLRTIREAVPIQSTWKFVCLSTIIGAIIFGVFGWIADRQYHLKLREEHVPAVIQSAPPAVSRGGNATTTGNQSPAITGNGNTVVINNSSQPEQPKSKSPK